MLHGAWETPCTHYKVTTDLTLHISNALRACVRARAVTCSLHPPSTGTWSSSLVHVSHRTVPRSRPHGERTTKSGFSLLLLLLLLLLHEIISSYSSQPGWGPNVPKKNQIWSGSKSGDGRVELKSSLISFGLPRRLSSPPVGQAWLRVGRGAEGE